MTKRRIIMSFRWTIAVISGVVSVCVLCILLTGSIMAQQPHVSLSANGVQGVLIGGQDSIPVRIRSTIVGGNAAAILPYTVVVFNTGSLPITGLDIRYEVVTHGDVVIQNFFYGSPGDIADSGSVPVIAPGGVAVISPFHKMNEQMMSSETISLSSQDTSIISRISEFYGKADTVAASIDSVIRSDGVLKGPDHSGTLRKIKQEVTGYSEFREQLLTQLKKGESTEAIVSWLRSFADAKIVRPGKNLPLDRSIVVKKALAEEYLTYLTQGRRQYAVDLLQAATPEVKLKRIIKIRGEEVEP